MKPHQKVQQIRNALTTGATRHTVGSAHHKDVHKRYVMTEALYTKLVKQLDALEEVLRNERTQHILEVDNLRTQLHRARQRREADVVAEQFLQELDKKVGGVQL